MTAAILFAFAAAAFLGAAVGTSQIGLRTMEPTSSSCCAVVPANRVRGSAQLIAFFPCFLRVR